MMIGTLLELLELGGPEAVTEQLAQFPPGQRKEFVRTVLASGFPVPETLEEFRSLVAAPILHGPHHLDVEVASTVRGLAAGKKITDHRGEQMLADYARLRITRHPVWPYHPRMWELRHNLGAYNAAYIALAEALSCELLTGDVKLKNAAGHYATVIVTR